MKHFFIIRSSVIVLLVAILSSSFTNKNKVRGSINGNEQKSYSFNNVPFVRPNPKSGVLNIACNNIFQSPLSVKVINEKGATVKNNKSLVAEGSLSHKFVQIITTEIPSGKYQVVIKDANGKESVRVIYLEK